MRKCFRRKVEEEPEPPPAAWSTTKYVMLGVFAAIMSGPLLVIIIHQVCVSKCLLVKRLPRLNSELDDLLLIALFVMWVTLDYITCSVIWSVLSKGSKMCCSWTIKCTVVGPEDNACLKDPKTTRSGRPYGKRTARYTASRTDSKPSLPEKSSWYERTSFF